MNENFLIDDYGDFNLIAKTLKDKDNLKLRIVHKFGGKNFAEHSRVQILNRNFELLGQENITKNNLKYLIENIKKNGTTEGLFVIKEKGNYISGLKLNKKINPESVLHKKTNSESSYTATGEKLNIHWPIFKKFKETNFGSIIRATMTLHQVCMSRCQFCSTIGRNKKDSINLEEAKQFVTSLYDEQAEFNKEKFKSYNDEYKKSTGTDIRLKGLILSGGGQPNLWPHFEEFVDWLSKKDISLGLITNGFPKKISEKVYDHFDWIRISITPEDASSFYPNGKFNLQYLPKNIIDNKKITLGLSYVYGPWTNDEILKRINETSYKWNCDYVRVLTDCNLSRDLQLCSHIDLSKKLLSLGFIDKDGNPTKKIFHQLKYHGTKKQADQIWDEGQCYLQTFNTFWDTTGHEENGHSYCFPCDSVTVLAEGDQEENYNAENVFSERKFNYSKWGTYKNTEVQKLYNAPVKSFFDPRKNCAACLFHKNNKTVKELIKTNDFSKIEINKKITHVNFP